MVKVAINNDVPGFCLSHKAVLRLAEIKGWNVSITEVDWHTHTEILNDKALDDEWNLPYVSGYDNPQIRSDPALIQVIEELGESASSKPGAISIVEVPDDVQWHIEESDCGIEWVAERHRVWTPAGEKWV